MLHRLIECLFVVFYLTEWRLVRPTTNSTKQARENSHDSWFIVTTVMVGNVSYNLVVGNDEE